MTESADPRLVVDFWVEAGPSRWFDKDPAFDARFRDRFQDAHQAAARRELDAWAGEARGCLALLLLLDQFPRNAYRGTAHMFATDPLARRFADRGIEAGFDRAVDPSLSLFFYLPFSHSESLADQDRAVMLNEAAGSDGARHARIHRDVIRRFGRFPHRNPMLGREDTPEERAFLAAGGFSG